MNSEKLINLINQSKLEFKEYCKNICFCDNCPYYIYSYDKIDCFEQFYIQKISRKNSQVS